MLINIFFKINDFFYTSGEKNNNFCEIERCTIDLFYIYEIITLDKFYQHTQNIQTVQLIETKSSRLIEYIKYLFVHVHFFYIISSYLHSPYNSFKIGSVSKFPPI